MGTPFQGMSSFVQRVTQWMSLVCSRAAECQHVVERQRIGLLDEAEGTKVPCRQVDARDAAALQHRPLVGVVLAGRDARLVDSRPVWPCDPRWRTAHATSGFETKSSWHGRGGSFHLSPHGSVYASWRDRIARPQLHRGQRPDAAVLLQSLLSNDVDSAQPGGAVYALLLTAEGARDLRRGAFNTGHGYVLACPPDRAQLVLESIVRARFRRKVELAPSPHAVVWGEATDALASLETPAGPHRLLAAAPDGVEPADAWEVARVEAGLPAFGREFDEDSMPAEAGWCRSPSASRRAATRAGACRPAPVPWPREPRAARPRAERALPEPGAAVRAR
jgi:hypothetical protein